ncbi:MAG: CDGSH iron-sulfur domain-containing protein [Oscillospiraceae bacterium]|nr:CDGSH iron-sulfur domain-containing protein [Oscillospiraceae bacterium]
MKIKITKDGPYVADTGVPLKEVDYVADRKGAVLGYEETKDHGKGDGETYLCRCGHSQKKPFCDGHHAKIGFNGTEVSERKPYTACAERVQGEVYDLLDYPDLCATGRFCDVGAGFGHALFCSDNASVAYTKKVGDNCPSGRFVLVDKETGKTLEPELEQEVYLIRDVAAGHYGPIHVRGGIQVTSADGFDYEPRNRVTLCRCGESGNMPFCDASHLDCPHMKLP